MRTQFARTITAIAAVATLSLAAAAHARDADQRADWQPERRVFLDVPRAAPQLEPLAIAVEAFPRNIEVRAAFQVITGCGRVFPRNLQGT